MVKRELLYRNLKHIELKVSDGLTTEYNYLNWYDRVGSNVKRRADQIKTDIALSDLWNQGYKVTVRSTENRSYQAILILQNNRLRAVELWYHDTEYCIRDTVKYNERRGAYVVQCNTWQEHATT